MSVYQHSVDIAAPAELVFEYVSEPKNFPDFVPWIREACSRESDIVEIEGKGYRSQAHLHLDPDERTMHWDSDPPGDYHGELQVLREPAGSKLNVCLIVQHGSRVDATLREALETIKKTCEQMPTPAEREMGYLG